MAVFSVDSGTQLAVIATEHTLSTQSAARTWVLAVDLVNLQASDEVTIRVKTKVLGGGTTQAVYTANYGSTPPTNKTVLTVPVPATQETQFTLEQTAGVGRNFDWEVRALD